MDRNRILRSDQDDFNLWFASKMEEQGKACAICHRPFSDESHDSKPFVDHDARHCGKHHNCQYCRRGLICMRCNYAIGLFGDDIAVLASTITYLENNRADFSQPGRSGKFWGKSASWEHRTDLRLNLDKAREIRRLRAGGMKRQDIADLFGVSLSAVKSVLSGRTWKDHRG